MSPQAAVRVGVAVVVRRQNSVLMGLRKGSHGAGSWSLPGGHLEPGETVSGCAARELFEETGLILDPALMRKLTFTNDVFSAEGKHYVTLYVECDFIGPAEPEVCEPDKCAGWLWCPKAPEPLFLPIANLLAEGFRLWEKS